MIFLGIKIGDHDSNFTLTDNDKVFYFKAERYLQVKHYGSYDPLEWVPMINKLGYDISDIDAICVTSDEELYRTSLDPNINFHLIPNDLIPGTTCPLYRLDHHLAHALSIWPVTDKSPELSFVFDGDGDFSRTFSIFKGLELINCKTVKETEGFGQILGHIALALGVTGHELDIPGKAMGLQSYGCPNSDYLEFCELFSIDNISSAYNIPFWESISQEPVNVNFLTTIHKFAEREFPNYFKKFANKDDVISFTGGVAQNSIINSAIQKEFPNCIIPPHASDDGLSLGCVEYLRLHYCQPKFDKTGFPFWQWSNEIETPSIETIKLAAKELASGKIIGWHQGAGEIGPRALGNRSILMDPRIPEGKDFINQRVKHREEYRPFGASVLEEHASYYFEMDYTSPYMLHVVNVKTNSLPAVTHVDGTCRVQTVSKEHIVYRKLLEEFYNLTGCPVLLNTSLNDHGKPIASSPEDSISLLNSSDLDLLFIGNNLYVRPTT
jgi:carbamoyltransferase